MTRTLKGLTGHPYVTALSKNETFFHGSSSVEIDLGEIHGHLNAYFRNFKKDDISCLSKDYFYRGGL